jgi:hypothetical protein
MMGSWNCAHRAFAVKAYYKNNDSYVSAQRVFWNHFNLPRNDPVPSTHAIKIWIKNFEATGFFPNHVISKNGDVLWPARSPDLSACDFFLWVYIKSRVFQPPSPRNIQELRERIRDDVAGIPVAMLSNVLSNLRTRLTECMKRNGGHLCDAIF